MPVKPFLLPAFLILATTTASHAQAPVTQPDQATVARGQKVRLKVLDNDTGSIVRSTLTVTQSPANGTAAVQADGTILYTNGGGAATSDQIVYRIASSGGQTATGVVTLAISSALKIANTSLNVPASPPATTFSLVNAFGTLSFSGPVAMATPPGDTKSLYVCEKGGLLRVIPDVTVASPTATTFLNVSQMLTDRGEALQTDSECGLLGVAFHPAYATNHYLYIYYSARKNGSLTYERLSRFTAVPGSSPAVADPNSELILFDQYDPATNHNGGSLAFGPDGYLYISVGDGGAGNDTLNNAQKITGGLFAGILRIDVDKKPGSVPPLANIEGAIPFDNGVARFAIPVDNPYVHTSLGGSWDGTYNGAAVDQTKVRREFWATGLRNPWRMSFDPANYELWVGDVGQETWEEIDVISRGANYGWSYREGNHAGPKTAPAGLDLNTLTAPIYEYQHGNLGTCITGGVVYRGTRLSALTGKYIFADYGSGNIWSLIRNGSAAPTVERIAGEGGIVAFGYDPSNQDVLLADIDGNRILRLTGSTSDTTFPATLSATGLFADLADLSPSPGLIPYTVNLPFWSDNAIKRRWTIIPDGNSQFTYSQDGLWTLPTGTIWVKHFDMEMNRGDAASSKRIETRLIVKNATGAYGVSYRWNEAGTEATLVADAGDDFTLDIADENGNPAPQTWHIPSRAECLICHTPQAGHALSFNTRQLNLANLALGTGGNQLTSLRQLGYLSNDPGSPNLLPRHVRSNETDYSLEARVRSYLAVNCSYCHKSGGTALANWDGRPELTLDQTGLINGAVTNNGGDSANRLVVPGSSAHSVIVKRMGATDGFTRMPPIGSNVIDTADVNLVAGWIDGFLPNRKTYDQWRQEQFGNLTSAQGAPAADPDGDGTDNTTEFLAGTLPLDSESVFRPEVTSTVTDYTLRFSVLANRSFQISTSSDLQTWTPWDVPGNAGLPVKGGTLKFTQPLTDPKRFFRINIRDN